ncbi:MAG: proton-conducting transporter membrane subunit [Candidatus Omnitrophica bacterium]|nr:proton-conducting transporter membrane subunit [Candidatus Omnitrophota bacterium]
MNIAVDFLLYAVAVPIVAGIVCLIMPEKLKILTKFLALLVTLASLAASVRMLLLKPLYWPPVPVPALIVDNLSALAGLGISFFALIVTVYSFGYIEKNNGRYFGYLLMTLGSALGAVLANNLILLVAFWGFLAVLLYLLVTIRPTAQASASAKKALIIVGGTDALMIFGIGLLWKISGTFAMEGTRVPLNGVLPYAAFLCVLIASFAKAGAVPFHSWLPDVAQDGPASVTAYLPASLDKLLGIYLLARISLNLFIMNGISNSILLIVGAFTIVFAVAIALVQHDFKRLLGYHAVSQVGYMILGIGTANPIGIAGGLFHMLNNALYKSCLFLGAGAVEKTIGTSDLSDLGGLSKYMPITFISFLVASLAISGIPPLNGFFSKWMIYQGIIESGSGKNPFWIVWLIAAMFGSALTIASFIKLLHAVFLGRASERASRAEEAGVSMTLPMVILAATCILFGIFAFSVPVSLLIAPVIGKSISYIGTWSPDMATALIAAAVLLGILVYLLVAPRKARVVSSFVGGENPERFDRVAGTEFYNTIREVKAMGSLYSKEESRSFDIYDLSGKITALFTRYLQKLTNGVLPTYIVWGLIGMVVMFIVFFIRG